MIWIYTYSIFLIFCYLKKDIDNILNLDDFIKDKIINELEKIKNQINNTEISVNESSIYKSVDAIIRMFRLLNKIN